MEMISILKGPAAVLLIISMGYLMVKWIQWVNDNKDREIARLQREKLEQE